MQSLMEAVWSGVDADEFRKTKFETAVNAGIIPIFDEVDVAPDAEEAIFTEAEETGFFKGIAIDTPETKTKPERAIIIAGLETLTAVAKDIKAYKEWDNKKLLREVRKFYPEANWRKAEVINSHDNHYFFQTDKYRLEVIGGTPEQAKRRGFMRILETLTKQKGKK